MELSAVLDIAKTGHRKRILHSLSETQSPPGPNMDEITQEVSQIVREFYIHIFIKELLLIPNFIAEE